MSVAHRLLARGLPAHQSVRLAGAPCQPVKRALPAFHSDSPWRRSTILPVSTSQKSSGWRSHSVSSAGGARARFAAADAHSAPASLSYILMALAARRTLSGTGRLGGSSSALDSSTTCKHHMLWGGWRP
eukprot:4610177-Prymnesium_polylepis.1